MVGFIKAGGYKNKKFWSEYGWEWKYKKNLASTWLGYKNNLSIVRHMV